MCRLLTRNAEVRLLVGLTAFFVCCLIFPSGSLCHVRTCCAAGNAAPVQRTFNPVRRRNLFSCVEPGLFTSKNTSASLPSMTRLTGHSRDKTSDTRESSGGAAGLSVDRAFSNGSSANVTSQKIAMDSIPGTKTLNIVVSLTGAARFA